MGPLGPRAHTSMLHKIKLEIRARRRPVWVCLPPFNKDEHVLLGWATSDDQRTHALRAIFKVFLIGKWPNMVPKIKNHLNKSQIPKIRPKI